MSKLNKLRKINRVKRRLLTTRVIKSIYMPTEYRLRFLKVVNEAILLPHVFNYSKVNVELRKIRYLLRVLYGNISEKQFNRIHRRFRKEQKNFKSNMPHNYFN